MLTKMIDQATALPWRYEETITTQANLPCIVDEDDLVIAEMLDDGHAVEDCEANARLICLAVNNLPALVEALEGCMAIIRAHVDPEGCAGSDGKLINAHEAHERAVAILVKLNKEAAE